MFDKCLPNEWQEKKQSFKGKKSKECSNFNEDKWMGEAFMGKSCWQMGAVLDYHMQVLAANM